MADHDNASIAARVRRKRRSSIGVQNDSLTTSDGSDVSTPPATPQRTKKRVRFSDPGPEIQSDFTAAPSGLTPFLRRTSLASAPKTKSKRRHSTPAVVVSSHRREYNDAPISGTLQFAPLRAVLDGRVKRRLRRNRLSEEINTIESDKRTEARQRRSQVRKLKAELAAKDAEVQFLQDEHDLTNQLEEESGMSFTTNTTLSSKVVELEQEIQTLKEELQQKEPHHEEEQDWTLAARDPFDSHDDDDDNEDEDENMTTNYNDNDDDDFTMNDNDEIMTTPRRLNTSFPSPPSTLPNTPCLSTCSISAGTQASLPVPDPENENLKKELSGLESEMERIRQEIALNNDNTSRLTAKLSNFLPSDQSHDHTTLDAALDRVLTTLALSQSLALEHESAFSVLSAEIINLGFSADSPDGALAIIASQFRQARLDLEYVLPGEVSEGFENEKLLGLLVERVRTLVKNMKERDESIDQYHDQELLLRQQLNTRVTAMDDLKHELEVEKSRAEGLEDEARELGVGNERLKEALEGYRSEVKELETLIQKLEAEGREKEKKLENKVVEMEGRIQYEVLQQDRARADAEGKDMIISEMERRLSAALQAASEVKEQLTSMTSDNQEKDAKINELNVEHGAQLALRDKRVEGLRKEVEKVNEELRAAQETILELKNENVELQSAVEGEKERGMGIVNAMREQLRGVLDIGAGYINGGSAQINTTSGGPGSSPLVGKGSGYGLGGLVTPQSGMVSKGRFLDGEFARKPGMSSAMGKRRRRYDSGLGFLEEESEAEGSPGAVFSSDF